MARKTRGSSRDVTVGAFTALAVIVLALAVMAVGGESRLFSRKVRFFANFASSDGLVVGSPVKISGVTVGTVAEILLPTDPHANGIEVALGVERGYAPRIREGSQVSLRFLQYLSGEKFVEVSPGDPALAALPPGATIPTAEGSKLLEQGEDIADNLNDITVSLKEILGPLQRGEGLLGQALHDPNFGKEGLQAIRQSAENVEALTSRLKAGQGLAGRLLFDPAMTPRADELGRAIGDLSAAIRRLNEGEGAAGDLLAKDGRSKQILDDLSASAATLRRVSERLDDQKGLLGKLLNDQEYSEKLATDLRTTVEHLNSVMAKIDRGEGTLGALVNDRSVYDGMEQVAAGVGDSKFANWLLRHYQKKGIEAGTPPPKAP